MLSVTDERTIQEAMIAHRNHNHARAQALINGVLERHPNNVEVLTWAAEFATTTQAQLAYMRRILAIDPENRPARILLDQILKSQANVSGLPVMAGRGNPMTPVAPFAKRLGRLVGKGALWLLPMILAFMGIAALIVYGYLYYQSNWIGGEGPKFDSLTISPAFDDFKSTDFEWKVTYESKAETRYEGTVRQVLPIRIENLRILTHDVLVTTGDYADPALVKTTVSNHMFTWRSLNGKQPTGKINLLHTLPVNQNVFKVLAKLRDGDRVLIVGREIQTIDVYKPAINLFMGNWQDAGCNTLLVTSITVLPNEGETQ